VRNRDTPKLPSQTFAACKRITPRQLHLKWESRNKNLYGSRTTLCNNSKGLERSKMYVQGHRVLHDTFDKKNEVRIRKNFGSLLKKTVRFLNVWYIASKVF